MLTVSFRGYLCRLLLAPSAVAVKVIASYDLIKFSSHFYDGDHADETIKLLFVFAGVTLFNTVSIID